MRVHRPRLQAIPAQIARIAEPPAAIAEIHLPVGGGAANSGLIDLAGLQPELPPPAAPPRPAPPPPAPPTIQTELLRQGGVVQAAKLIYDLPPVYPELAKRARIQGVVVVEAVIGKEGAIDSLRIISGHPLLNRTAVDAVKQWRYRPTLLNGQPVAVLTTVTVTFALQ